ncbi:MAG: class I SAM-dependent methyltransferase [Elusimicrobiota bacterium]|nr:MAG: class I SAM-dependent methyltransferase [Elusimicrobiota bacterium]
MTIRAAEEAVRDLLSESDVVVGGHRPWDVRVSEPAFFERALQGGASAVAAAYVDGWWDCDRLDQLFTRLYRAGTVSAGGPPRGLRAKLAALRLKWRASGGAPPPDDAPDDELVRAMLGGRLAHHSGYWAGASTLDEAQEAALELVCLKLDLRPGMTVLELGCGWGAFARYAAERHGVGVLGVEPDAARAEAARAAAGKLPVEIVSVPFASAHGRFDRVVALGSLERLPEPQHRPFVDAAARCLKDDGVALLDAVVREGGDPWPGPWRGGVAPTMTGLTSALESSFVAEDFHNLGPHGDPTMLAWHANLERAWPALGPGRGERPRRAANYRLLAAAGAFRARRRQIVQAVLTKAGRKQPHCRADVSPLLGLRNIVRRPI